MLKLFNDLNAYLLTVLATLQSFCMCLSTVLPTFSLLQIKSGHAWNFELSSLSCLYISTCATFSEALCVLFITIIFQKIIWLDRVTSVSLNIYAVSQSCRDNHYRQQNQQDAAAEGLLCGCVIFSPRSWRCSSLNRPVKRLFFTLLVCLMDKLPFECICRKFGHSLFQYMRWLV